MLTVIGNLKGGTGKSTVAFNLAVWLAHGKNGVKVFDLDPQRTLVDVNEVRTEDGYEPTFEVSTDLDELEALAKDKKLKQDIIVDMLQIDLGSPSPSGIIRVAIGAYDPRTAERYNAQSGGSTLPDNIYIAAEFSLP